MMETNLGLKNDELIQAGRALGRLTRNCEKKRELYKGFG